MSFIVPLHGSEEDNGDTRSRFLPRGPLYQIYKLIVHTLSYQDLFAISSDCLSHYYSLHGFSPRFRHKSGQDHHPG